MPSTPNILLKSFETNKDKGNRKKIVVYIVYYTHTTHHSSDIPHTTLKCYRQQRVVSSLPQKQTRRSREEEGEVLIMIIPVASQKE